MFLIFLNDDVLDIEKPDGICSPSSVMDEPSGLFLDPSIFSFKYLCNLSLLTVLKE